MSGERPWEHEPQAQGLFPEDVRGTWGFRMLPTTVPTPVWGPSVRVLTHEEWLQEGLARFGADKLRWAFRCPACDQVQSVAEFLAQGIDPQGKVFTACLGRYLPPGRLQNRRPCVFTLQEPGPRPKLVVVHGGRELPVFEFAEPQASRFRVRG